LGTADDFATRTSMSQNAQIVTKFCCFG